MNFNTNSSRPTIQYIHHSVKLYYPVSSNQVLQEFVSYYKDNRALYRQIRAKCHYRHHPLKRIVLYSLSNVNSAFNRLESESSNLNHGLPLMQQRTSERIHADCLITGIVAFPPATADIRRYYVRNKNRQILCSNPQNPNMYQTTEGYVWHALNQPTPTRNNSSSKWCKRVFGSVV